jgi:hypothetical protein
MTVNEGAREIMERNVRPYLRLCSPVNEAEAGPGLGPLPRPGPCKSTKVTAVKTDVATVTDTLLSVMEDVASRILELGVRSGTWTREDACQAMTYCAQSMAIQMKYGRKRALDPATLAAGAAAVRRIADGLHVEPRKEDDETPE